MSVRVAAKKTKRAVCAALFALLAAAHLLLILMFIRSASPTFDEPAHIAGGMNMLLNRDFRANPESGVFPQVWAALPVASALGDKFPRPDFTVISPNEWDTAYEFIYNIAGDHRRVYTMARLMTGCLSVLLGTLIAALVWRYFGPFTALIILAFYSFWPVFISNGGLVTSDTAVALGFFLAAASAGRMLRRISPLSVIMAAAAFSLLFLSKMSAVIIIPAVAGMLLVRTAAGSPSRLCLGGRRRAVKTRAGVFLCGAAALAAVFLCVWAALWAGYGFRYSMSSCQRGPAEQEMTVDFITRGMKGFVPDAVRFAADRGLLPEAYLYGFAHAVKNSEARQTFFFGRVSGSSSVFYFPFLFLVKTPVPVLLMFAAGLILLILRRRRLMPVFLPFIVLGLVLVFFLLRTGLNIGFRHMMPVLPVVLLLCAPAVKRLLGAGSLAVRLTPFLLALWAISDCFFISPHFLAYFNPVFGGPSRARNYVVDSSLDWGQDLEGIKPELAARGVDIGREKIYLSYFGTARLKISGLDAVFLPCYFPRHQKRLSVLEPGVYCVSATMLRGVGTSGFEAWRVSDDEYEELERLYCLTMTAFDREGLMEELIKQRGREALLEDLWRFEVLRFERLRKYLLKREPDFTAGYSILIYRLSADEIKEALKP